MKTLTICTRHRKSKRRVLHPAVEPSERYTSHTLAGYYPEMTHCGLKVGDDWRIAKGMKVVTCPICWFKSHAGQDHHRWPRNTRNYNE